MLTPKRHAIPLTLLILAVGLTSASAQAPPRSFGLETKILSTEEALWKELRTTSSLEPTDDKTFTAYDQQLRTWVQGRLPNAKLDSDKTKGDVKQAVDQLSPKAIEGKTTAVTAPDGFAGRVTDTIADFIPLFGLSMDAVSTSDDKKSATLKLNPLKGALGALSVTSTATQPTLFSPLSDAIKSSSRDKETKAILAKVNDFGDVTTALTYGYAHPASDWKTTRSMYSRDYDLYRPLIDNLLESSWGDLDEGGLRQTEGKLGNLLRQIVKVAKLEGQKSTASAFTFGDIRRWIRENKLPFTEADLIRAELDDAMSVGAIINQVNSWNLDALPTLVDNQPQLTFAASYRSSDNFVGPDEFGFTLHCEIGAKNFNTVLREYQNLLAQNPKATPFEAFQEVIKDGSYNAENKLIVNVTYKRTDSYNLIHTYDQIVVDPTTGDDKKIPRTAVVDQKRSSEWRGNLAWTRFLMRAQSKDNKTGVELPRITLSVEAVQIQDDPNRQNHVIAKLSYIMPTSKGVSFPLTLTWANRSEFLGEQNRTFSAHLGLSYKLDSGN